jgi:hypothetical protein
MSAFSNIAHEIGSWKAQLFRPDVQYLLVSDDPHATLQVPTILNCGTPSETPPFLQ